MPHSILLGLVSLLILQGAFSKPPTQQVPVCSGLTGAQTLLFEVGDINGDGTDDYIVRPRVPSSPCKTGDSYLMVSKADGKKFTQENLDCSLNFHGLDTTFTFADFNNDGRQDILRRDKGDSSAEIMYYFVQGTFMRYPLPSSYSLASDLTNVITGDFNKDGKADFIRQQTGVNAQVFLSTCALLGASFTKVTIPNTDSCINIIVGDFDGDNDDDFICQEKVGDVSTGHLFLSQGNGLFTKKDLPASFNLAGEIPKIIVGDFNDDGKTDFVFQTTCPPTPSTWYWADWITFTPVTSAPASATGTITTAAQTVQVSYSGDSFSAVTNGGFLDWTHSPAGTYVNGPTIGDILYVNSMTRPETITFSQPVVNPRFAFWSLGQQATPVIVDYGTSPVSLISYGQSYTYPLPGEKLEIAGPTQAKGTEGNGIIEVQGTFTQISFTKLAAENWWGFTVGIPELCSSSSLYLATGNGDFTNVALPEDWDLDGQDANLSVGDFNCDGKDDILRQDTGAQAGSTVNEVTVYGSTLSPTSVTTPPFSEIQPFNPTSPVTSSSLSTLYMGDFNGDTKTDYIQYWSDSCYEIVTATGGACTLPHGSDSSDSSDNSDHSNGSDKSDKSDKSDHSNGSDHSDKSDKSDHSDKSDKGGKGNRHLDGGGYDGKRFL